MSPEERAALYRDIFEADRRGAAILEDLVRRFARPPPRSFDQAAVNETFARAHQRAVLDYIVLQINLANGVNDEPQPEGDQDG